MNKLREEFEKFMLEIFFTILGDERHIIFEEEISTGKRTKVELRKEELNDELKKAIWNWINKNYISKQQILNLECLKEEKLIDDTKVDCMILEKTWEDNDLKVIRNQLREEIIDEINKL